MSNMAGRPGWLSPFAVVFCMIGPAASAQEAAAPPAPNDVQQERADGDRVTGASPWHVMTDGVLFGAYNHQGGKRGGDEFDAPNWVMSMAMRSTSRGLVTFTGMLSLDPATLGENGYREIFQVGESLNGRPLIDRQHPHDFFMQLAASWRIPLGASSGITFTGAPVGEPALGPPAFMHRASAGDNPTAPLSHHTFDSTHVSFGVVTAGVDRGPWTIEGSVFNGREPDQDRWDFDFRRLDSVSGRLWFRPSLEWSFQVSIGRLRHPEQLEAGDLTRTTASVSWTRIGSDTLDALTAGYGRNDADDASRQAAFVEGAHRFGRQSVYGRVEVVQLETALVELDTVPSPSAAAAKSPVVAATVGGLREVLHVAGLDAGVGADVTFYGVPDSLQPSYGNHPISFKVFVRLRPSERGMRTMMIH
jgi:hypothetical protein